MRALTVLQPWADCICGLGKRVENRTWPPPNALIGQRIAIHAGKGFDSKGHRAFYGSDLVGPNGVASFALWLFVTKPRARGAVVATTAVVLRPVRMGLGRRGRA